jgi:hypothetical protein
MKRVALAAALSLAIALGIGACADDDGSNAESSGDGGTAVTSSTDTESSSEDDKDEQLCVGFATLEQQRDRLADEEDLEEVADAIRRTVGGLNLIQQNGAAEDQALVAEVLPEVEALAEVFDAETLDDPDAGERIFATPEFAAYRSPGLRDAMSALEARTPDCN